MKVPIRSLRSFEVCSSECQLFEPCNAPGTVEIADIGSAVRKATIIAADTANLPLAVHTPQSMQYLLERHDLDISLADSVWSCARNRALGRCAGTETVETELL